MALNIKAFNKALKNLQTLSRKNKNVHADKINLTQIASINGGVRLSFYGLDEVGTIFLPHNSLNPQCETHLGHGVVLNAEQVSKLLKAKLKEDIEHFDSNTFTTVKGTVLPYSKCSFDGEGLMGSWIELVNSGLFDNPTSSKTIVMPDKNQCKGLLTWMSQDDYRSSLNKICIDFKHLGETRWHASDGHQLYRLCFDTVAADGDDMPTIPVLPHIMKFANSVIDDHADFEVALFSKEGYDGISLYSDIFSFSYQNKSGEGVSVLFRREQHSDVGYDAIFEKDNHPADFSLDCDNVRQTLTMLNQSSSENKIYKFFISQDEVKVRGRSTDEPISLGKNEACLTFILKDGEKQICLSKKYVDQAMNIFSKNKMFIQVHDVTAPTYWRKENPCSKALEEIYVLMPMKE